MSTVVNNPAPAPDKGNNSFLIGVILFIAFVAVLLYFGIPIIREMEPIQVNVNVPAPQVNMPDKINVNVTPAK